MKTGQFVIFFSIVIAVYGAINFYIYIRGLHALPACGGYRLWYSLTFWLLAATFIAARILERSWPCGFTEAITWIGSFWLAAMLFFFLFILVVDVARLLNYMFGILPAFVTSDPAKTKIFLFWSAIVFTAVQSLAGYINACTPRVVDVFARTDKPMKDGQPLTIAMASDIHLGTVIGPRKAEKLVSMLNGMNADIILLVGDVVDEDIAPVIRKDIGRSLLKLNARYGVWGITGNHEYIGGADKAVKYLTEHRITFLRDTFVVIDNRFTLAGREDRDKPRFTGIQRQSLKKVLEGADPSLPLILMDHQPFQLDSVAAADVDLQLSGHTHHGQIWPFNYITQAMYTLSWGYLKINNTNFYVSCGYGTWGPPIRLGNRPEVVRITLGNSTHTLEAR
jgi:predicted MPP superfamily phosphohydrolase